MNFLFKFSIYPLKINPYILKKIYICLKLLIKTWGYSKIKRKLLQSGMLHFP